MTAGSSGGRLWGSPSFSCTRSLFSNTDRHHAQPETKNKGILAPTSSPLDRSAPPTAPLPRHAFPSFHTDFSFCGLEAKRNRKTRLNENIRQEPENATTLSPVEFAVQIQLSHSRVYLIPTFCLMFLLLPAKLSPDRQRTSSPRGLKFSLPPSPFKMKDYVAYYPFLRSGLWRRHRAQEQRERPI